MILFPCVFWDSLSSIEASGGLYFEEHKAGRLTVSTDFFLFHQALAPNFSSPA